MKLNKEQTKAVNAWFKKHLKKYDYDQDQACDDICYDLDLKEFYNEIYKMIEVWYAQH